MLISDVTKVDGKLMGELKLPPKVNVVNGNRKCLSIEAIHHEPGNCRIHSPTVPFGVLMQSPNLILSFVCKLPESSRSDY